VIRLLPMLLLVLALVAGCGGAGGDVGAGGQDAATVARVVDGDTIRVAIGGREEAVRLIGIDTPETVAPERPVECFGPEASTRLADLLGEGEEVRLETDPTQDERDRFGRLLAYVFAEGESRSANERLVESGHARVFVFGGTPFARADDFMRAEAAAREEERGLWGACESDEPEVPTGECDPGYSGCVPPHPPDVDCDDVDGPVTVRGDDPHRLDGDGDGLAC